jgi:hypothetical protein
MEIQTNDSTPVLTTAWKLTGAESEPMGKLIEVNKTAQLEASTNAQLLEKLNQRFGEAPIVTAPSAGVHLNA